jgi:hypothetical protein
MTNLINLTRRILLPTLVLAGAVFAAAPRTQDAGPAPAAPLWDIAATAASCGPPPPPASRRPRPEEEGCSETPSPALARR